MSCQKNPILRELLKRGKRSGKKHQGTLKYSLLHQNLVFPVERNIPVCVVLPVRRTEVPAPEITREVLKITIIIDLEISEALEQRRRAYREENHPPREINQFNIGSVQNRGFSKNEISDAETIIIDSESETEQISE